MSSHHTHKGPSQRQLRVGEQLRHIIAETMSRGHFHHEALLDAGRVSVTEVRVTPDLKNAKAYVMSLGGADMDIILPALNEEAHVFQKEIGRQQNMKFTPKIRFVRDESFDEAQRIDDLLRGVHLPEE
ncbi:MAG TPA: 30S ribosome-binding factor RbfA [Alphaproteobacteria bacterium]|nr:30S ribosome-binding factor RbfA [Alphaproteobacteria bacterium]USO06309.1 MAG: 30S ribosome-binding factor RbfA [Rhodospirillales bacterium]HOO81912.1 30S ribosome-binding factor RbfA [Alphaproteobacteria bacterium]